jgi:hypothetical protein
MRFPNRIIEISESKFADERKGFHLFKKMESFFLFFFCFDSGLIAYISIVFSQNENKNFEAFQGLCLVLNHQKSKQ